MILFILFILVISTLLYGYLHKKTRISIKFLFIDNILVTIFVFTVIFLLLNVNIISYILSIPLVIISAFALTMLRFWRTPKRKIKAKENEIVSPADGNIIYIKKIEANQTPISIKNKHLSKLDELSKTDLLTTPCWLIGINMTPFDVHKNCSPIDGQIILNKHFDGKFLSLKNMDASTENERNTYVINNSVLQVGVVQIASKRVRRIDSYTQEGQNVKKGDWLGMIRFGSQVDVILPINTNLKVLEKQQIYAGKTIIGSID